MISVALKVKQLNSNSSFSQESQDLNQIHTSQATNKVLANSNNYLEILEIAQKAHRKAKLYHS